MYNFRHATYRKFVTSSPNRSARMLVIYVYSVSTANHFTFIISSNSKTGPLSAGNSHKFIAYVRSSISSTIFQVSVPNSYESTSISISVSNGRLSYGTAAKKASSLLFVGISFSIPFLILLHTFRTFKCGQQLYSRPLRAE